MIVTTAMMTTASITSAINRTLYDLTGSALVADIGMVIGILLILIPTVGPLLGGVDWFAEHPIASMFGLIVFVLIFGEMLFGSCIGC